MKILEYTLGLPPYRRGGLPKYSLDLARQLSKTDDVYLMYPGEISFTKRHKLKYKFKHTKEPFTVLELCNPLPVSLGLGITDEAFYMEKRDVTAIIELFRRLKIEVVHFHTLMGVPLELLVALKEMQLKMIFTTHDYYGLCPKMLTPDPKKRLANYDCSLDCMLCKPGPTKQKLLVMQSHLYARLKETKLVKRLRTKEKNTLGETTPTAKLSPEQIQARYELRKYYLAMFALIDEFHFNSTVAKAYFERFIAAKGNVVSITHAGITDQRKQVKAKANKPLVFAYIGPYDLKKGFFMFKAALQAVRKKYTDFEVIFCGDVAQDEFFEESWVTNYGVLSQTGLKDFYQKIDVLVMPSLWHETFGFVALEGISQAILVLVSENVGAKDLLPPDCVFAADEVALEQRLAQLCVDQAEVKRLQAAVMRSKVPVELAEHVTQIKAAFYS